MRIRYIIAIFVLAAALSMLTGPSADAGLFDWFRSWFTGPVINQEEPKAGAVEGLSEGQPAVSTEVQPMSQSIPLPEPTGPAMPAVQPAMPAEPGGQSVVPEKQAVAQPVEEKFEEDWVDPRKIQDVMQQFKDMRREIKRIITQLKKQPNLKDDLVRLNEISGQINTFEVNLKNPPVEISQREVLQDFYDTQLWDEINQIRARVEFPKQVKDIKRELTRVEKLLKQKTFQKIVAEYPGIKTKLGEIKAALTEAENYYQAGEIEDAMETLRSIHDDTHPGDLNCILNTLRDIKQQVPKIKNAEIKQAIQEILDPITAAVQEEDFRGACQSFNEIRPELEKIMRYAYQIRKTIDPAVKQKIEKLQQLMEQKFGEEELKVPEKSKELAP